MATRLNDIETTFHLRVSEALQGLDQIISKTKQAEKGFGSFEATLKKVGIGLAAFGAASTTFFAVAVKGALAEQEQLNQLRATVEGIGESFEAQAPGIESFVDALTQVTKFTDDELRPALNRAILATGSVAKAMEAVDLASKVAASGIGTLEGNVTVITRLFQGQVTAIGRLIPEFRDLDERLEAGASQADLAAEALARLNAQAEQAPKPDSYNLLSKAIGELNDAAGKAAFEGLAPLVVKLTEAAKAAEAFVKTDFGRAVTPLVAGAGVVAGIAGTFLIFTGNVLKNADALSKLVGKIGFVQKALSFLAIGLAGPAGLIALLIIAAGAVAAFAVVLNKASKAADEARDKLFASDRATQFKTEMGELAETIEKVENNTISASDASKTFNKFGVQNLEQAKQRVEVLGRIVARLEDEKGALEDTGAAAVASGDAQKESIDEVIAKMEEEKQKRIELEILKEEFERRELEAGKKLAAQVPLPAPELPQVATPQFPLEQEPAAADPGLAGLTEDVTLFNEEVGTAEDRVQALVDQAPGVFGLGNQFKTAADEIAFATERAIVFGAFLEDMLASAIDGLATLAVNFGSDLVTNFENAGKNAAKFFRQLIGDLTRAIAKALILEAVISSFGGGGGFVGRALGKLFQDPQADQLARFEGSRFSDLFFQGMFREFNTSQERLESALTQNRDIVRDNSKSMTAIVNEATPETTVQFTDRHVEPRVRQRANQRSSRGTLTDAERDRQIENINDRLDAFGAA